MNKCVFLLACICIMQLSVIAQNMNVDLYLCDFIKKEKRTSLGDPINITNRVGYDNQPSFSLDGKKIYYSALIDKTNDVFVYDIASKSTKNITNTPSISEYSPTVNSNGGYLYTIHIEEDGKTQRFWKYNLQNSTYEVVFKEIDSTGYFSFYKDSCILFFILGTKGENHSLQMVCGKNNAITKITDSVGRCIRERPNTTSFSFVDKTDSTAYKLKVYSFITKKVKTMYTFRGGEEDYAWISKTEFIYASGSKIYLVNLIENKQPIVSQIANFSKKGIKNIKRISYNAATQKICFAADDNKQ